MLYKPTDKVESVVKEIMELLNTPLNNGVAIKSMTFDKGAIKIANLYVRKVAMVKTHLGIEVHWFQEPKISTTQYPYCSAFMLRYNSLVKLKKSIQMVISSHNNR